MLERDRALVEKVSSVSTEQTRLVQEMREEVDELYETTYKLNRLLFPTTEGDLGVKHSRKPATRNRIVNRRRDGGHFTASPER